MEFSAKVLVVIGIWLIGAGAKQISGPWLINRFLPESSKALSPVIFIPGDGGSQIDAKLNKPKTVHIFCDKKTKDWFNLWLNVELLAPLIIDCWIDNTKLYYDNVTRISSNAPGVDIRIPGWGDPESVEWIDPSHIKQGAYFKEIGNALVRNGYVRNVSLRGAPYDFRKAPSDNQQWFIDLKKLVEDTYEVNDNQSISFIAHSMGAPMLTIFCQMQSDAWKQKYIARMITLAGAYGGTAKSVKTFAVGDDLGVFALRASVLRESQRTMTSLAFLLPFPAFWQPSEILVRTRTRAYTYAQLNEFFEDLGYPIGWEMRKDNQKFVNNVSPPNVEIHCLYGSQIDTIEALDYMKSDDLSGTPEIVYGDGDGTINTRSLTGCNYWRRLQKPSVNTREIPKVDHVQILSHPEVISYILDVLVN